MKSNDKTAETDFVVEKAKTIQNKCLVFEPVCMEIINFNTVDIITTSSGFNGDDDSYES